MSFHENLSSSLEQTQYLYLCLADWKPNCHWDKRASMTTHKKHSVRVLLLVNVLAITWWTFRIFVIFLPGEGKGKCEAPGGGGGSGFVLKIPGGGGLQRGGPRGWEGLCGKLEHLGGGG